MLIFRIDFFYWILKKKEAINAKTNQFWRIKKNQQKQIKNKTYLNLGNFLASQVSLDALLTERIAKRLHFREWGRGRIQTKTMFPRRIFSFPLKVYQGYIVLPQKNICFLKYFISGRV